MTKQNDGRGVLIRASQTSRKATIGDAYRAAKAVQKYAPQVETAIDRVEVERRTPLAESGLSALVRHSRGRVESGIENPLEPTGTTQDTRFNEVNAAWNRLERDISAARHATPPIVTQAFYVSFLTDYNAWSGFRADHASDRFTDSQVMGQIEQYRQTMERWRTAFQGLGGQPTGSPTQAPPPPTSPISDALGDGGIPRVAEAASGIATAVAVVAVAGVLFVAIKEGGAIAKRAT